MECVPDLLMVWEFTQVGANAKPGIWAGLAAGGLPKVRQWSLQQLAEQPCVVSTSTCPAGRMLPHSQRPAGPVHSTPVPSWTHAQHCLVPSNSRRRSATCCSCRPSPSLRWRLQWTLGRTCRAPLVPPARPACRAGRPAQQRKVGRAGLTARGRYCWPRHGCEGKCTCRLVDWLHCKLRAVYMGTTHRLCWPLRRRVGRR